MSFFLKDILEPLSYLIYTVAVFLILLNSKLIKIKVLFVYYLSAALLLFEACSTANVGLNNMIYNLFFFTTISVVSYYFRSLSFDKPKNIIISSLFFINVILFIKSNFIDQQFFQYNTGVYAITFLSIVIYALFYFDHVIRNVNELNLLHQFDFWLISGYLFYFLSSFFIILFYHNMNVAERGILWSLQNIILFLSSVLTLTGSLWIHRIRKYY